MDLAFSQALQETLLQSLDFVGGSNKTANGFQTRAGIIPQNHRGSSYLKNLENLEQMSLRNLQTYEALMKSEYQEYQEQSHYQQLSE